MATITLPKEYGYVLASATLIFGVSNWHGYFVGTYRKKAQIGYPRVYADAWSLPPADASKSDLTKAQAEYAFNCAQRAHGQFLEHLPVALSSMLVAGVRWPVASAALGAFWAVNRVLFAQGYVSLDKEAGKGRYRGITYLLAELGLMGMVGKWAFDLIMA